MLRPAMRDTTAARRHFSLLAGSLWLIIGTATLFERFRWPLHVHAGWRAWVWGASWALMGTGLVVAVRCWSAASPRARTWRAAAIALQAAAAFSVTVGGPCFLDGVMVGLVAWQVAFLLPLRWVVGGVLAQTALLISLFAVEGRLALGAITGLSNLCFQLLAILTARQARADAEARGHVQQLHAELVASREENLRRRTHEERLRIARELHDVLGHQLTAMSLFLESAGQQVQGKPLQSVQRAQELARSMLQSVREVVDEFRGQTPVTEALRALAQSVDRPLVHLTLEGALDSLDAQRAHTLLRCVQEMVTNSLRHAGAQNIWVQVSLRDGRVEARVRDDGRGAEGLREGHGLSGMRERLASLGGTLSVSCAPDSGGFEVAASLGVPATVVRH